MSLNDDRPNAGEGADDQDKADWNSRCDDLNALPADGQLPPLPPVQILVTGFLTGLEPIQEVTDLRVEELPYGYQCAIRKVVGDPYLFQIFEKIAFIQIHKHGSTSADKIEGEIRTLYRVEFCHYSRTLLGRLFQWKYPQFAERVTTSLCILDKLSPAIREELILRTR